MNKTTKIIIVAIIAFIAGGLYFAYHSYDEVRSVMIMNGT